MKKLLVLAMMATLLTAGSAFAVDRHLTPAPNATFAFGAPGVAFGPTTTNNDDTCDIGVAPAATLLLPYFEVDLSNARTQDTLFTITNVTRLPQIAHVTVWTDWSFPVLDFNIYLTGYDVQGISMNQLLAGGIVASQIGTGPTQSQSPLGALSSGFTNNPNFAGGGTTINCGSNPGPINNTLIAAVRTALTTGVYNPGGSAACATPVGGTHANAIGYVTVDVASNCSLALPTDPNYYTRDILFDNVLIGDYQQLGPTPTGTAQTSFDAGGNAMVHIRAVPEGGAAGSAPGTNLPYTFYDRYTPATNRTVDRRQPLPALWAARYIQGGPGNFATNYKIWREGFGAGSCGTVAQNATLPVAEVVRFDEHENPVTSAPCTQSPCPGPTTTTLPETSAANTASAAFPTQTGADVGGWMYLNLNNGGSAGYSVTRNVGGVPTVITGANAGTTGLAPTGTGTTIRPSQNWVIVEMFGNVAGTSNRLTVDFDAAWLGNGCSAAVATGATIAPAGGVLVCPPGTTATNGAACTGTNVTPLP